jgi:long-chain fatty acid transport protein
MSSITGKTASVHRSTARGVRGVALAALAGLLVSGAPATAEASGFLGARFGADQGTPVGANPFAIFFNPAAMGPTKGTQLSLDVSLIYRMASYERSADALSPSNANADKTTTGYADYQRSNTGKNTVSNLLTLPFLGVTSDLGTTNLRVGLASYVPFGGQSNWTRNTNFTGSSAPGGNDGPQRWFNISGRIISLYNTLAVSYTIPEAHLTIGGSGSLVLSQAHTVRARNADGSDTTSSPTGQLVEGRSLVDVSGKAIAAAIGIYWEPIPEKLMLGASFTARPGFGQTRMKGTLDTQLGQGKQSPPTDVELTQTLPDIWRLGVAYRASEKVELRADMEYVTWSVFQRQCLVDVAQGAGNSSCNLYDNGQPRPDNTGGPSNKGGVIQVLKRNWHDAYNIRAGVGYFLSDTTEIFGSGAIDTSAVPKADLDPTFIDGFKILGTIGVRQKFGPKFALGASYNHVYMLPVDNTGQSELNQLQSSSKQPSASGKYTQQFMFVNLNGTMYF